MSRAKKKAVQPAIEFKPNCSMSCRRAGRCVWRRDGICIAVEGKGPKPIATTAKHAAEERKTRRAKA